MNATYNFIKLKLGVNSENISVKPFDRPNWLLQFKKKNKRINYLLNNGILTGSRVLAKSFVNNKQLLNRKIKDWDFILTKEQFIKFINKFELYNIKTHKITEGSSIKIENHDFTVNDGYGGTTRFFPNDINIIIRENEKYLTNNNIKYTPINTILYHKNQLNRTKDKNDLNRIYYILKNI